MKYQCQHGDKMPKIRMIYQGLDSGKTLEIRMKCQGPDGNSMAPNFPKLAGQGERYLDKQLHDIKSGKRVVLEMTETYFIQSPERARAVLEVSAARGVPAVPAARAAGRPRSSAYSLPPVSARPRPWPCGG